MSDDNARMTIRMREAVAKRAVNYSFESVAADFNISPTTAKMLYGTSAASYNKVRKTKKVAVRKESSP